MRIRLILWLILPFVCFSQKEIIRGKVIAETSVSGVLVVNLTQQTQVSTNDSGNFTIKAQSGDLLIFSALHLYRKRHLVEADDFRQTLTIEMEIMPYEIQAVEIERGTISAEDLGIIPKGRRRYTVAERRLKTATDWNPELGAGTMIGASLSLDPLLNALSGRTKMLKNELKIERFNRDVTKTTWYLSDQMIITEFEIPEEYTTDFRMYLVENNEFRTILKTEKETLIISTALRHAPSYKLLIADEK